MLLAVNLLCCALFLPFLAEAAARVRAEPPERRDLPIWIALGALGFAAALLSRDLERMVALHWFGAAFLGLTLGYGRGLLTSAVIVTATTPLATLGPNLLVDALLPVWLMWWMVGASRRRLAPNPFVFLFACGFFGLFAISAVQLVLGLGVDALLATFPAQGFVPGSVQGSAPGASMVSPWSERLAWGLMLAAGEATLEGMLVTVLVVYLPRAVVLFDERHYLRDAPPGPPSGRPPDRPADRSPPD